MRKKILVIDDDHIYCSILKKILGSDYDVTFTENSAKAIEIINRVLIPDLIIADLNLPDVKGLEFIKILMSKINGLNTSVIVISGFDDEQIKSDIVEMGVSKYFVKPIERFYLKQEIDCLL
jgi:PleD family two-component response regulator